MRFEGLLGLKNVVVTGFVIFFFIRVYALHLVFGFTLRLIEYSFSIKRRWFFYILTSLYGFLFLALKYPQIFDESVWLNSFFLKVRLFEYPWLLPAFAVLILLFLNLSFYIPRSEKAKKQILYYASAQIFLVVFFFHVQKLEVHPEQRTAQVKANKKEKPHIVILTMDSLRGDRDLEKNDGTNASFKKFLGNSFTFDRVISGLAQTHGALSTLFTAQSPPKNGVRSNLSSETLDTDKFLDNSELAEFKKQGYRIEFLQDTQEYSNFFKGNIIDSIDSPSFSIANVFISNFFKNRLIFAFFNNALGHLLLPETYNNTSFVYSYDVADFTNRVNKRIADLAESDQPTLLFVHTCAIHWPGVFPYPYYPTDNFPSFTQNPFSYTSRFRGLNQKLNPANWEVQSQFNQNIYDRGVDMLVQKFLNPVMEQLDHTGILKNSVVVLMSDHGENFWKGAGTFPKRRYVEHGGSLIFGADSELANLHMSFPNLNGARVHKNVGIVDILPSIADYLKWAPREVEGKSFFSVQNSRDDQQFYYTETGLWMFSLFSSQFSATPIQELGPLFRVDPYRATFYTAPGNTPAIVQQKQRALYWKNFRYTLFPTNSGYREFLCDRDRDYFCTENLVKREPFIAQKFRETMHKYIKLDIDSNMLTVGSCSSLPYQKSFSADDLDRFQWQYYFQAHECMDQWHDYAYSGKIFTSLLKSEATNPYLRTKILDTLLRACSRENVFGKNAPEEIRQELTKAILEGSLKKGTQGFINDVSTCFTKLGLYYENSDISQRIKHLIAESNEKRRSQAFRRENDSDFSDEDSEVIDFDNIPIGSLFRRFVASTNPDREALRAQVLKHPDFSEYRESYQMVTILEKETDPDKVEAALKNLFKNQEAYDLTDDRLSYLRTIWFMRFRKSPDQAMIYAIHQMTTENLPLEYFNLLLYDIDVVTRGRGINIPVDKLREQFVSVSSGNKSFNLKSLEVGLSVVKLERYFCSSAKKADLCNDIRQLKTTNTAAKIWDEHLGSLSDEKSLSQFLQSQF